MDFLNNNEMKTSSSTLTAWILPVFELLSEILKDMTK